MLPRLILYFVVAIGYWLVASGVSATEYSSANFKVLDPVLDDSAGAQMSSTSYRLRGVIGELVTGRSSAASFTVNAGSLAFPTATTPTLTATAGSVSVALTWTASQGALGWTVTSYEVCTGTSSDTYTSCTDVGNVTSSTRTGLTAATLYFFRVRAKDAFGNVVVRSSEASATPTAAAGGTTVVVSGGGGSPGPTVVDVTLTGRAYPAAVVSLLQNGAVVREVTAGTDGRFTGILGGVATGRSYTFGAQARDGAGRSSVLLTFTVSIRSDVTGVTLEFFLAPTIELSAANVTRGAAVTVRGTAFPSSVVRVEIPTVTERTTTAQSNGTWTTTLDTTAITPGTYNVRASAAAGSTQSEASAPQTLTIASAPVTEPVVEPCRGSDVNRDARINSADVSVLLTFWNRTTFTNRCADINQDGRVDLVDFSILLFNWTG